MNSSNRSELTSWLTERGSITQRLIQNCADFNVRLLDQSWQRPTLTEAQALPMPPHQLALVRQVLLCCGDTPWLYARTVIPVSSFKGRNRRLLYLRNKPLGAALFQDRTLQRQPLQTVYLSTHDQPLMLEQVPDLKDGKLIGRQSVFVLHGRPLQVSEYFLPAFMRYLADKPKSF